MPYSLLPAWRGTRYLSLIFLSLGSMAVTAQDAKPAAPQAATPQTATDDANGASSQQLLEETGEELPYGELAPAAVQLDESKASPLIQELYAATRETKIPLIVGHLTKAKGLIDGGADLKATDSLGRTALHWTIFGSSYANKQDTIVAYEEVASDLLQHGVEINHEDAYNDTALDYLLYSPNFEMQTLLIENSATSGFLAAFYHFFDQVASGLPKSHTAAVGASMKADL